MKVRLYLILAVATLIIGGTIFSFAASTFLEDWNYYQKISRQQKLTPNDHLYVLYRLLAKYQKNPNYATKLKKEIVIWENKRKETIHQSTLPKPPENKMNSPVVAITKVFATDTPDFSQVAIFAPNIQKYNYFLLTDPDPTIPPKIVIDLYNTSLAIPEKERVISPESGEISEIRLGQFENFPNKIVRAVVTIFNKKPYQIVRDKQYLLLLIYKNPTIPIPPSEEVIAHFNPATLNKSNETIPEAISPQPVSQKARSQPEEQKISLLGEIRQPGYYEWKKDLKLVDLISTAGGFTEEANISRISLLRKQDNQTQSLTINLKNILNGTEPDIMLMAGDAIYIPKKGLAATNEFISTIFPWLALIAVVLVIRTGLH